MTIPQEAVLAALRSVAHPYTGGDFLAAVRNLHIDDGDVSLDLELGYPAASLLEGWCTALREAVQRVEGVRRVDIHPQLQIQAHAVQRGAKRMPGVKNLLLVSCAKGGVGKSTVAVNLAVALAAEGARVGLLDADVYGPSVPTMMGLDERPHSVDGDTLEPLLRHGVQCMSIGLLAGRDEAMVWRGPMAARAFEQLLRQTRWDNLDYLIVDMPPGTGDMPLTLAQRAPVTGTVVVTTPQEVALLDARKGIRMFEKVGVAVLGVVENMAAHVCSQCGHVEALFGAEGGRKLAEECNTTLLGSLPLSLDVRVQGDTGMPIAIADADTPTARSFRMLAHRVGLAVAGLGKDYSEKFGTIEVVHGG